MSMTVTVPAPWRRGPRIQQPRSLRLALREISGHLTLTGAEITAWYRMDPVQWAFEDDGRLERYVHAQAEGLVPLAGRTLHVRVTDRPYAVGEWQMAHRAYVLGGEARTPGSVPVSPAVFDARVAATAEYLDRTRQAQTEVYLGVSVAGRRALTRLGEAAAGSVRRRAAAEPSRLASAVRDTDETVAYLGGRPATPEQMRWLLHRSVGLGLPEPTEIGGPTAGTLDADDLYGWADAVDVAPVPGRRHVRVTGHADRYGRDVTRLVAVLTLGRMEDLEVPGRHLPWLALPQALPFPVEVSCRAKVVAGPDAAREVKRRLDLVRDQAAQYRAHPTETHEPPELERVAERAREIEDEMRTGTEVESARVHAWPRLAVSADSEDELRDRVRRVRDLYRRAQVTVERPVGQMALARSFIPGEGPATVAHRRSQPLRYFAAAVPQVSSNLSDGRGWLRGVTCGHVRRPVIWDMWEGMLVREQSGFTPVLGGLGAGKTFILGGCAEDAVTAGIETTCWDPQGTLAALCFVPHLRDRARHLDLLGARPGTLSPYAIVPAPSRRQLDDHPSLLGVRGEERARRLDELYTQTVAVTVAERRRLAVDVVRMLLPRSVLSIPQTELLISEAVEKVEPTLSASLWSVVRYLERHSGDDLAPRLAGYLRQMSELPRAALFFEAPGDVRDRSAYDMAETLEEVLLVVTMAGLVQPDFDIEQTHWGMEERLFIPLTHLGTVYTTRRVYGRPMNVRKLLCLDEAHFLTRWPSGKAFTHRAARTSRAWRTRVLAASQKAADFEPLGVAGLVSDVWCGRVSDPEDQAKALRLLGAPVGVGHEDVLAGLSPERADGLPLDYREFIFRRGTRRDLVRVDYAWSPDTLTIFDPDRAGASLGEVGPELVVA